MKKISLAILAMACTTILQAELITEYFENGVIKSHINYSDGTHTDTQEGVKEGVEKIYHSTGQLALEVHNTQGLRDGELHWYDQQGRHLEVMQYKKGKRHGLNQLFYENGTLRIEVNYVEDNKEGIEKFYFSTGELASEVHYIKGKKEGLQKEYNTDGTLNNDVMYVHGYKEGLKRWYDKHKKVIQTENYIMDRPIDTMKRVQTKKTDDNIDAFQGLDFNPNNKRVD